MWLKCMILLCAAYEAMSEDPTTDPLAITALLLPASGGLTVCYTGSDTEYVSSTLTLEDTGSSEGVVGPIPNSGLLDGHCFTFPAVNLALYKGRHLTLILKTSVTLRENDGVGTADILVPTDAGFPVSITVDVIGEAGGVKAIRVRDGLGGKSFYIGEVENSCPITAKESAPSKLGPPCYFMDIPNANNAFSVCNNDIGEHGYTVSLCTDNVQTNSVESTEHGPDVTSETTSITLDHTTKSIFLQGQSATSGAKAEMVVRTGSGGLVEICQMELAGGECKPGGQLAAEYNIFITYTDSDKIKVVTYDEIKITNRNLNGVSLTPEILEVSWTKDEVNSYDQLTRDIQVGETSNFNMADVDCSLLETQCYAYFTGLKPSATYTLTLGKITAWTPMPPGTHMTTHPQLESTSASMMGSTDIHTEPTTITVTESNIELDVCFTYITNTSTLDTHYEFLAVNSKGKWKKEIVYKKKDGPHACFHGLELSLADFSESSKFFVLLRDSNNGKTLASGEVTFDLPAPRARAIKPGVDNGSNGSTSTLAIVGAAIAGIACLMALVAAAVMFVMKINRDNDGLQYPLHPYNIEDSNVIHGQDNPIPTM